MRTILPLVLLLGMSCGDDTDTTDDLPYNGTLTQIDGVDVLTLWGTREEIGYAEGALLCDRVTSLYEDLILDYIVPNSGMSLDLMLTMAENTPAIPEGDEAELRGILTGMRDQCDPEDLILTSDNLEEGTGGSREISYDDLVLAAALPDYGCSSLTVWGDASATGELLHVRNFDYYSDPGGTFHAEHLVKVYRSDDQGGVRFASISIPGVIGCISCVTEEGRGMTMHNSGGLDATEVIGFTPRVLGAREAIAATWHAEDPLAAAEDALEARPTFMGNNLHFFAPGHGAAVMEWDGNAEHPDGYVTRRDPGEGLNAPSTAQAITCTNHYAVRSTGGGPYSDSVRRMQTLSAGIDDAATSGGLDQAGGLALAEQVSSPSTVYNLIYDHSDRTLTFRRGSPDQRGTRAEPAVLPLDELFAELPE